MLLQLALRVLQPVDALVEFLGLFYLLSFEACQKRHWILLLDAAGVGAELRHELSQWHLLRFSVLLVVRLHFDPKRAPLGQVPLQLAPDEEAHKVIVVLEAEHAAVSSEYASSKVGVASRRQ